MPFFTPLPPRYRCLLALGLLVGPAWQTAQAQTIRSAKRGEAYGYNSAADLRALAPGVAWWYNWAPTPDATGAASVYQALGVEYVPTQWNGSLDGSPVTADRLDAKISAGVQYLLGFNEPNFRSQANLTPSQAAAVWPALQEVARRRGLKLVAPSVNYCGDCVSENGVTYYTPTQYLDAFFAACPSCQVDYIAVHTYVCQEQYLRQKVAELKKYNKPIWVTEFACGDMPAGQITAAVQQKYLLDAVNYLEKEPAVFRYAWFSGRNNEIPNINLLGSDGQLTALGQLYVGRPAGWEAGRLVPVAVTASSQETTTTGPANAADRDINSRWASALGAGPQYVQLDFGAPQAIARVQLSWEAAYAQQYQLQTSLDGQSWTTIQTVTNGDGGLDDLPGLQARARYLRVYATQRATTYGYSLYEVEAFGLATALGTAAATAAPAGASLYPNPATGAVTVQWPAAAVGSGHWLLTNATGQVVRTGSLREQVGPNELTLNTQLLPAGSYVLTLEGTTRQHLRLLKAE
ncbi:T9SS type A sorting domain-containing protein [Hymenobacter sp. RP-2-7]|uniref:T9SS type A sorting domain-containing protein n=1 Tax=Hymenobacter polaris TaxID=2682546 RepID=A0A7Y0ADK8_9BACT|nr:glycosyl hydrolase [Hymenobacter polaris]NML65380.1 T9SS type A sorting domain-containing protein [Hymenobacter polaris]